MRHSQSYNPTKVETIVVWASPCSLVTTKGISYDLFSSSYLDISFHWVLVLLTSGYTRQVAPFGDLRFQAVTGTSPKLFAANYVLHTLFYPRHPFIAHKKFVFLKKNEIYYTTVNYLHQNKTFQNKKTSEESFA